MLVYDAGQDGNDYYYHCCALYAAFTRPVQFIRSCAYINHNIRKCFSLSAVGRISRHPVIKTNGERYSFFFENQKQISIYVFHNEPNRFMRLGRTTVSFRCSGCRVFVHLQNVELVFLHTGSRYFGQVGPVSENRKTGALLRTDLKNKFSQNET